MVLNLPNAVTFNTISRVVVTPNHEIISLLLHNLMFASVMNSNINIWYAGYLIYYLSLDGDHWLRTSIRDVHMTRLDKEDNSRMGPLNEYHRESGMLITGSHGWILYPSEVHMFTRLGPQLSGLLGNEIR